MDEEDEEEEPEAAAVALAVRLEDEAHLAEVGDAVGQMMELHLCCKQNQDQAAAQTCRSDTAPPSVRISQTCYTRLNDASLANVLLNGGEWRPEDGPGGCGGGVVVSVSCCLFFLSAATLLPRSKFL